MKSKPQRHHRILRLRVTGGFLDGLDIEFADGLNCIIGPRGVGKTTIIELIRYAIDAMPGRPGDPLRRRVERMIAANLDDGEVEVVIETGDGVTYTVSRAADEEPTVMDDSGHPVTGLKVRAGRLFRADILSQNQIESIAETAHYQLDLIDKFSNGESGRIAGDLEALKTEIDENTSELLPLLARKRSLAIEIKELPDLEEKLKGMKITSGPAAEAINSAQTYRNLRDQEMRAIEEAKRIFNEVHRSTKGLQGRLTSEVEALFPKEIRKGPNAARIDRIFASLKSAADVTEEHLEGILTAMVESWAEAKNEREKLEADHARQDTAYRKLLEKHKEALAKSKERTDLGKRRNQLHLKKRELADVKRQIQGLKEQREELLAVFSELCDERFEIRQSIASRLTKELRPGIRVNIAQCGDRKDYEEHIAELLRGCSIRRGVVARKISEALPPMALVELLRAGDRESLAATCALNDNQIAEVFGVLCRPENLLALETVILDDAPSIEFRERGEFRESALLSTGQKCTAILPILLMESINPLVIDQPEDNLDNSYVYETVVQSIRKAQSGRQMIFATHNPNIPVLGNAARVFVMDSSRTRGEVLRSGDVDECKEDIVTILEGGEEAFMLRKKKYNY